MFRRSFSKCSMKLNIFCPAKVLLLCCDGSDAFAGAIPLLNRCLTQYYHPFLSCKDEATRHNSTHSTRAAEHTAPTKRDV